MSLTFPAAPPAMADHPTCARRKRTAVVHEWLGAWGGAESVTAAILQTLNSARLYALFDHLAPEFRQRLATSEIATTFLQRLPGVRSRFWYYLPLMPLAIEQFDLRGYDTIISSSHAFAKGVLTSAEQLHLSYIHSPMRYAWDLHHQYLEDYGFDQGLGGILVRGIFHRLRNWDRQTANNVDLFVANSENVSRRIWRTYRRPSVVIYPPVDVERFTFNEHREGHYLSVSRLVSYKRVDLIVKAFNQMPEKRLVVIGDGPELEKLKGLAQQNVEFLGHQPDNIVATHFANARALVFAANEDFGITPVEAQAAGTPVIAYGAGGALETIVNASIHDNGTGLFFDEQTPQAIIDAIRNGDRHLDAISPHDCRSNAERFSSRIFRERFSSLLALSGKIREQTRKTPEKFEQEVLNNV